MDVKSGAKGAVKERSYVLTVNGRERAVNSKKQTYRDIALLAYPGADFDKFMFTITFFRVEGGKDGDLVEGEKINVKDGMVFNVRRSDRS